METTSQHIHNEALLQFYKIRLAQLAETDVIVEIVHEAYRSWIAIIGREPAPMLANYHSLIQDEKVYAVEEEGRLVAVLVIWQVEDYLYIDNIAVRPSFQQRGIGDLLLQFAEQQARHLHLRTLRLLTNEKMESNQAYYRKHGYSEISRETTHDGRRAVWMEKPLPTGEGESV